MWCVISWNVALAHVHLLALPDRKEGFKESVACYWPTSHAFFLCDIGIRLVIAVECGGVILHIETCLQRRYMKKIAEAWWCLNGCLKYTKLTSEERRLLCDVTVFSRKKMERLLCASMATVTCYMWWFDIELWDWKLCTWETVPYQSCRSLLAVWWAQWTPGSFSESDTSHLHKSWNSIQVFFFLMDNVMIWYMSWKKKFFS